MKPPICVAVVPVAHQAVDGWTAHHARRWAATHRRVVTRRQAVCRAAARVLRSPWLCSWVVRGLNVLPALAAPVLTVLNHPLSRDR